MTLAHGSISNVAVENDGHISIVDGIGGGRTTLRYPARKNVEPRKLGDMGRERAKVLIRCLFSQEDLDEKISDRYADEILSDILALFVGQGHIDPALRERLDSWIKYSPEMQAHGLSSLIDLGY